MDRVIVVLSVAQDATGALVDATMAIRDAEGRFGPTDHAVAALETHLGASFERTAWGERVGSALQAARRSWR